MNMANEPSDYPSAPAPWTTKGEMYWLLTSIRKPLSPSIYSPLEAQSLSPQANEYKGGWGYIQIIRYTSTPVGPYDELMILPGDFSVPGGKLEGKSKLRINRIYVSQKETTWNGRKNWNIPKHLARFEFSAPIGVKPLPKDVKISVYPPGEGEKRPFFEATLSPSSWLPSFPISTKYLGPIMNTPLVQPPLPTGEEDYLCGTETWKAFNVHVWSDRARLMRVKVDKRATLDQEAHWPQTDVWSFGLWLEDGTAVIEEPEEFTVRSDS